MSVDSIRSAKGAINESIPENSVQKSLQKAIDCFFLLRIPLLAPVWTILILGWISGKEHASPGGVFTRMLSWSDSGFLWLGILGFSLIVASIYVVNQIADIESDRINHKLFLLPHKIISIRTAWVLASLCAVSGMLIASFLGVVFVVLFATGLFIGFLYDLPPFELKNHAWGGVISNSLGHGILTFLIGWFLSKEAFTFSTDLLLTGLLSSAAAGFANGAVFLATTIPDAEGDARTGKKTFCVKYGEKATARTAVVFCALALIFSFFIEFNQWVMIVPTLISLLLFLIFTFSTKKEMAFQVFKWPVFLLSATVAVYIPEYAILIFATFFGSRIYYRNRFGIEYPTFKSK
ncbi:MAG: UbiA family prenyltransferase [Chitinispirillaceae bacterium]|nr:UbiA family prenyltransferase [Chitinispirillaceae bacterium]